MEKSLILLALGLAASYRLDRKYLPPPSAKFSGGNPEDLQTPLEFNKEVQETTSTTPMATPYNELLRSVYYDGSIIGPNFSDLGPNIDTTISLKNPKTFFPSTSPMTSYTYYPTTYSPEHNYETTTSLVDTNKVVVPNFNSQQSPYKPIAKTGLRKYFVQNKGIPIFYSSASNTQNQGLNQFPQDIVSVYGKQMNMSSTNNPQYIATNLISTTSMIQKFNSSLPHNGNFGITRSKNQNFEHQNKHQLHGGKGDYESRVQNKPNSTATSSDLMNLVPNHSIGSSSTAPLRKSTPLSTRIKSRLEIPQAEADRSAVILKYQNIITPERFSYSYDTSNGISINESGTASNGVKAQGAYSYTGDDGKVYSVVYKADENGFQPIGDHLPKPPLVPTIQRLIEKTAREKDAGIFDDGSYDEAKYGHKKYHGVMEQYHPEIQGFTNGGRNKFNENKIKQFSYQNIRSKSKTRQNKYNKNNQDTYRTDESNHHQDSNFKMLPINQRGRNHKLSNVMNYVSNIITAPYYFGRDKTYDSDTKKYNNDINEPAVFKKFDDEVVDTKEQAILLDPYKNTYNLENREVTKTLKTVLDLKHEENKQRDPINSATLSLLYSPEQPLYRNENVSEIISVYNTYNTDSNQATSGNKPGLGYVYIAPQNKFIENVNQILNKERFSFNTDQELTIGDDDIITTSVPLPNTLFNESDYEVIQTASSYIQQNTTENKNTTMKDFEYSPQEVNSPENSKVPPTFFTNLTTAVPSNINKQTTQQSDPVTSVKFGASANPVIVNSFTEKYTNNISKQPQTQTIQEYNGTSSVIIVDAYGRPITEKTSYGYPTYDSTLMPVFYGHGTTNGSDISNIKDFQQDYSKFLQSINEDLDRNLGFTAADKIISEDFGGPKRAQSFDPKTGYYY